ncbi:SusC/RagA family TonB-linked outer membrane protein [Echinicola soli]|uniref:SusC/RagA family TonB-linked outer membrane protein n=1 Tax=Echinicola soli TaxID=2591634 RepID=UPI001E5C21DB|nr:SusC/RagA family TonB-linked outer membrane protein [Echinicola soli]
MVGESTKIDVTLGADAKELGEVVITASGLEANKSSLGYAVQNVDTQEILDSKEPNLVNALNAKVAGVQVTSSAGTPGASSSIRIRGSVSVNKSNQPLFVVDGIPIDNSTGGGGNTAGGVTESNRAIDLNPNDIASLTVLKGAAATALYGVRAANGAIVITTKKGKAGKPVVKISTTYAVDKVNKLPKRQNIYAQGAFKDGVATYRGPETAEGDSWGPMISELEFDGDDGYFFDKGGKLVPKGTGNGVPARAYDPYSFFENGRTINLNASVSGGNETTRYYFSGGRLDQKGVIPNASFQRTSFRSNLEVDISEKLSATMSASFSNSGGFRVQQGSNINGIMLGLLRNTPTFDIGNGLSGQSAANEESTYVNPDGSQRSYRWGVYDSPYWTVNKNPTEDNVNRVIGIAGLKYEINKSLYLSYKLGIDHYSEAVISALDINLGGFGNNVGSVTQRFAGNSDVTSDLVFGFNHELVDGLTMTGLVGYNLFNSHYTQQETFGNTLAAPNFYHISNAADLTADEDISRKRIHGLYSTLDFSYNDWAFLNLTGRNDWSSALPSDNNTYQSYSVSTGIVLSEAIDIRDSFLDYLKLRASYGVIGNDAPIYSTANIYSQAESDGDGFISSVEYPSYGTNAFERGTLLANPQLTPERATTYEVGGEVRLFNGRFGLDVTYFNTQSEDVIIEVQTSATTGYLESVLNSGEILNKGWEIIGSFTPVESYDFRWDIEGNFTSMENTVEQLAEGLDRVFLAGFTSTSASLVTGMPYSTIWGDGFQRADDGRMIIGSDGWPLADPEKKALGDPNPDFTLGLRNSFEYKGIRLSALLDFRKGGDVWCGTCGIMDYFGTSQLSADERNDKIVFDGVINTGTSDNPVYVENDISVPIAQSPTASEGEFYRRRYGFGGITEMNIWDGSWMRLRELTLSYTLPDNLLDGIGLLEGAGLSVTGRNLWLKTDYPGIDPETNLTGNSNGYGLDYFNSPNTKSVSMTLNLTF